MSFTQVLLPWEVLLPCLNIAAGSLVACGLALVLASRKGWSLPARHGVLVAGLVVSLAVSALLPAVRLPTGFVIPVADGATVTIPEPESITSPTQVARITKLAPVTDHPKAAVRPAERPVSPVAVDDVDGDETSPAVTVQHAQAPAAISNSSPRAASTPFPWLRAIGTSLCGIWLLGCGVGLFRAVLGILRLRRWLQSVTAISQPCILDIANVAARNVGLRRAIALHQVRRLPAPVTCGLIRPRIVLPMGLEAGLAPEQLRAVIQHEMAHVVRGDLWLGALQQIAAITYWWNPLMALANRRLADLREQICDDIAIRDLSEPETYAATLINLAERCSLESPVPATLGIGSSPASQLEIRIRRILSGRQRRTVTLTRRALVGVSTAAMFLAATMLIAQVQIKPAASRSAPQPLLVAEVTASPPVVADKPAKPPVEPAAPASPPAAPASTPAPQPQPQPEEELDPFDRKEYGTVDVPGRVIGPDGQPVAGATIFLRRYGVRAPIKKTTTNDKGEFQFTTWRRKGPKRTAENAKPRVTTQTLPGGITVTITDSGNRQGTPHEDDSEINGIKPWLVATAPGFGFGTLVPGDGVTIKLVADTPITGKVTNEAGQPLAGARVRVRDVFWMRREDDPIAKLEHRHGESPLPPIPPGEGLDPWIATVSRAVDTNEFFVARGYLIGLLEWGILGDKPSVYAPLIPPVTTDAAGNFKLAGVGRDRVTELYVDNVPDRESTLIVVANRNLGKPVDVASDVPEVKKFLSNPSNDIKVFGNRIDLVLGPGRQIAGRVTDQATGAPIMGVRIVADRISRLEYPGFDRFFATTDQQGHYQIDGFPVMKRAEFTVEIPEADDSRRRKDPPPPQEPYFGREVEIEVQRGTGPQQLDLTLTKGIWITGKVVDDATGKGLDGETIEYHAFNDNPFLMKDLDKEIVPEIDDNLRTNADGSFRIRGYPGRGIVTGGGGHDYLQGIGADKIRGLRRDGLDELLYRTKGFSPYLRNTTVEVNIPADAKEFQCEVRLVRGKTRMVDVVDTAGERVLGLEASGLANQIENPISTVGGDTLEITNLFPGEERAVVARNVAKKLMGMTVVKESEDGVVTLTLQPWANLKGRLVDDAGQPRFKGLRIQLDDGKLPIHTVNGRNYDKQEFLIDPDGTFHIDGLVPDATYQLQVIEGGFVLLGNATGKFTLNVGETRDLGDVKVLKRTK